MALWRVKLFEPGDRFIPVSITGYACQLLCEYCRGRWLRGMHPAPTPEALERLIEKRATRLTGVLVSGGFTREGRLPIEPFLRVLERIRRRYPHLIISMHTGLVTEDLAAKLEGLVDIVDYEVPLTRAHLRLMHLPWRTLLDYIDGIVVLQEHGLEVAPHFLLGLSSAASEEEKLGIERLSRYIRVEVAVILYYTGAPRSAEAYVRIEDAVRAVRRLAREVALGCMRPRWLKREEERLLYLFDRLANPSAATRKTLGIKPLPYCCSVPSRLLVTR